METVSADPKTRTGADGITSIKKEGDKHPIKEGTDKLDPKIGKVREEGEPDRP